MNDSGMAVDMTPRTSLRTVTMTRDKQYAQPQLVGLLQGLVRGWKSGFARRDASASRQMRVIETLTIGPKKHLVLVSCGRERFLVGTGADRVQRDVLIGPEPGNMNAGTPSGCV